MPPTRNLERTLERVVAELKNPAHTNWEAALNAGLAIFVEAFRNEPGFRSLRVGDVIDLRPNPTDRTYNSVVADRVREALVERFDLPNDEKTSFLFECAIEVSDAMAARAFTFDPQGEVAFLDAGRDMVTSLLVDHLGKPTE